MPYDSRIWRRTVKAIGDLAWAILALSALLALLDGALDWRYLVAACAIAALVKVVVTAMSLWERWRRRSARPAP